MNSIPNLKHASKIPNSISNVKDRSEAKSKEQKIFSKGGHRKRDLKVIVLIINHINTGKGVYKNTIVCAYKTLNSISKKAFHVLVHIVTQLRLNDAWVTRFFDLFPIREEIISREMTICSLYGRSLYGRRTVSWKVFSEWKKRADSSKTVIFWKNRSLFTGIKLKPLIHRNFIFKNIRKLFLIKFCWIQTPELNIRTVEKFS